MTERFVSGWWLVPGAVLGTLIWIWALAAVLALGGCMSQPAARDTVPSETGKG